MDESAKALKDRNVRQMFVKRFIDESDVHSDAVREALEDYLLRMEPRKLVEKVISGVRKSELDVKSNSLADYISAGYPYYKMCIRDRCLGMQIAAIEFARGVLGLDDADSGEFSETCDHKIIDFMPDQYGDIPKGGTMRLGAYPCVVTAGTIMERAYGTREISERHRHRYEFNNEYREA